MKKILTLLFCLLVTSMVVLAADKSKSSANPLLKSDTVIWAGLDYSMVRMYGTMDFKEPEKIFPDMLDAWNGLFLTELVFHETARLQKAVGKTVKAETEGMAARNRLAKTDQVIRQDGNFVEETHIKDADIADAVRSYKLASKSGLGLVFIVDRLVKVQNRGAVYIVFFDVATLEVISKQRLVVKATGFGFRNFWFRVPKDAIKQIKKVA